MEKDTRKYWPHIDGLRAVAVAVVFIFHLLPDFLPGGYLGVDIFFVISGFVITQSLYSRYQKTGSLDIGSFYIRRFLRLYPALLVMVLTVSVLYVFLGFLWDTNLFLKSSISSIFAFSNLYFLLHGETYFDEGLINPLLHTWSLGIEEQFYLIYPVLLFLLVKIVQFFKKSEYLLGLTLFLLAVGLYIIFFSASDTYLGNYYWPTARFWELLTGCALYFLSYRYVPQKIRNVIFSLGSLLILIAIVLKSYISSLHIETLLAVLGSAGVIYGGLSDKKGFAQILKGRYLIFIGLLSYSIYLWHLPVIYFLNLYTDTSLYIILSPIITFVLGYLSYKYIETTFKYTTKRAEIVKVVFKYSIPVGVMIALCVFSYGIRPSITGVNIFFNEAGLQLKSFNYIEKEANLGDRIKPNYFFDNGPVNPLCSETSIVESASIVDQCYKNNGSERLLYLSGDSHAIHFLPMVNATSNDFDVYFQGHTRADFVDMDTLSLVDSVAARNKHKQLEVFTDSYEEVVLMTSFFLEPLVRSDKDLRILKSKMREYIELYKDSATLVFVAPTPVFRSGPVSCVAMGVHCEIDTVIDQLRRQGILDMMNEFASQYEEVLIFDPYQSLCEVNTCRIYDSVNDVLLYRDDDHISVEASVLLAPAFDQWFNKEIWQE